jgi:hypothetical protein
MKNRLNTTKNRVFRQKMSMTDFPLYVKISADTDIGAHAQADGDDIRFTLADGITVIPHETESFSTNSGSATGHFCGK